MLATNLGQPVEILLAEDSKSDVLLMKKALQQCKIKNNLTVVSDGAEAMDFLHRKGSYANAPRPGLILLDLNMPRKNGREVLVDIKQDDSLKTIPVVVLTTSAKEQDVIESYGLHANCYMTKPVDMAQFMTVVQAIEDFWFTLVQLPCAPAA